MKDQTSPSPDCTISPNHCQMINALLRSPWIRLMRTIVPIVVPIGSFLITHSSWIKSLLT
jgi:hypothetical protein